MGNLVAIVGRPNVGKSTLFNRLTKSRQAIVNEQAGTTRDRQYGKSEWLGKEFSVVDTGGWVVNSDDVFEEEIRKQVMLAIDEADVILFVVDVMNGVTDLDMEVAEILRRSKTPVLLVANKTDNNDLQYNAAEFYSLGLGDPYCVSALSGSGTGDLLDLVLSKFKKETPEILDDDIPRFAVVGRPNAGKSSIINAFIGEDRNIVTEIAGTTRDSIYTRYNKFGFDFYLVDTAGIRKKNKVSEDLEYYSVIRSIRSIENSDVCILMLDATRGIEGQDLNIFSLVQRNQKGLVVVVNGAYMTMTRKDSEGVLLYDTYSSVKVPIDGKNIYNPFLGAYYGGKSVSSGSVYTRFNSNINLITHIPKLRLITTLTVQCVWLNRTRNLQADGVYILDDDNNPVYGDFSNGTNGKMIYRDPDFYMNMDGQLLPFNRDLYNDPTYGAAYREYLQTGSATTTFVENSFKPYFMANLRVTKEIGRIAQISFYANNFTNSHPKMLLKSTGTYKRVNTDIYFGAELKLKF